MNHDSTRCAKGLCDGSGVVEYESYGETRTAPCLCNALPTEGVGAVDLAAADSIAEAHVKWQGTYSSIEVSDLLAVCRAYLSLRASVASEVSP